MIGRKLLALAGAVLLSAVSLANDFSTAANAMRSGDYSAARSAAEATIAAGNPAGHQILGDIYRRGLNVTRSEKQAKYHYEQAHLAGLGYGSYWMGVLSEGADAEQYFFAATTAEFQSDSLRSEAGRRLALIYEFRDPFEAYQWLETSSWQNDETRHIPSTWELGYYHLRGIGVTPNRDEAARLFAIAMDNGDPDALERQITPRLESLKDRFVFYGDVLVCDDLTWLNMQLVELGHRADRDESSEFCFAHSMVDGSDLSKYAIDLAKLHLNNKDGEDLEMALLYAQVAQQYDAPGADRLVGDIMLRDFVYGNDRQAFKALEKQIKENCPGNIECAFKAVWEYLDVSDDDQLSLAELSRFQRVIVKLALVEKATGAPDMAEITGAAGASVLVTPLISTAIINSFDYDSDGFLQPKEVLGDSQFSDLVGLNAESLENGFDVDKLQRKLQQNFGSGLLKFIR